MTSRRPARDVTDEIPDDVYEPSDEPGPVVIDSLCRNCQFKPRPKGSEFCSKYCREKWARRAELRKHDDDDAEKPWPIGPHQFHPIPGIDDVPPAKRLARIRADFKRLGSAGIRLRQIESWATIAPGGDAA